VEHIRSWFIFKFAHGDRDRIFMDVDTMAMGVPFDDRIKEEIRACDGLIAIIGPRWLELLREHFNDFSKEDYLRQELALALELEKPVFPILIKDATFPDRNALPPDLGGMYRLNARSVSSGANFVDQISRIVDDVEERLSTLYAQRDEFERAYSSSPGAGLALSYYLNFIKLIASSMFERDTDGMMHPNAIRYGADELEYPSSISAREHLTLDIIIPSDTKYLGDEYQHALKAALEPASIRTANRVYTVNARLLTNGGIEIVDLPSTLRALQRWIKTRERKSKQPLPRDFETNQLSDFYNLLDFLVQFDDDEDDPWDDDAYGGRVKLLRYDPTNVIEQLRWLHDIWKDVHPTPSG
jgi:hypothetical protein